MRVPFVAPARMATFGLALALAAVACSSPGSSLSPRSSSPGPTTAPTASPAATTPSPVSATPTPAGTPIAFVSERYGYAVELLPGWFVRGEGGGKWTPQEIGYVGAGTDAFELDYAGRGTVRDFPGVTYGLYVSAAKVDADTRLEEWTALLAQTMHRGSSCQGAPDQERVTAGGEPADVLVYDRSDCTHDHHVLLVSVLRGESGFLIMWLARRGEEDARRADFEHALETFRFTQ